MSTATASGPTYYITFKLGDELFAIDVRKVREVLDLTLITRVPTAPHYMRGVVNVRGTAIPVVDLRLKFGLPPLEDTVNTRILVLELHLDGEQTVVGGLADSVHDVFEIEPQEIGEAPRIAMRWRSELIAGMAKRADQFVIILDIDRVFALEGASLAQISAAGTQGSMPNAAAAEP
jgi:purine-binding chemotaxis protein CheW